ncbi:hypothetical protein P7C70_g1431, partial [Phenoliferia sp. Uapishka_3]
MAFVPATKGATTSLSSASPLPQEPEPEASTSEAPPVIPLPPLHVAAQAGDLATLHQLLAPTDGTLPQAKATDLDPQGITALHWASINNHVLASKFLIESGADVDAVGGDLSATPLHWAARSGHLYIVHLLLKYNADPNLLDSQSFNTLHLAVHSSSAFLLAYVLFTSQPVAVDSSDTEGHTALHWACYQGDSLSVDLLLRAGADPRRADNAGLTPLHWAAVKGNSPCIKRLIEAGADQSAREQQGKTPKDMATELKSLAAFKRGLVEAGLDEDGRVETVSFSKRTINLAIFALPTLTFFLVLNTLAILPWWSGLLLAFAEFFGMHHIVSKVLLGIKGPHHSDRLTKSPYLCSVIAASVVWVVYVWLTRYINGTTGLAITNLFFAISALACVYNFFRAITLDPGHVPFPVNDAEMKEMVEDLVEIGSFNGMNFCLPWRQQPSPIPVVRDVPRVRNHVLRSTLCRMYVLISVQFGWDAHNRNFDNLDYTQNAPELPAETACVLPTSLCTASHFDTFALATTAWAALQLSWTIILLGAQLWQICRQMTTLEVSNVGRFGYMGGKPGVSAAGQQGFVEKYGGGAEGHVHGPACDHGGAKKKKGKGAFLLKILGIDRFTEGKAAEGLAKAGKVTNPFDLGVWRNCADFWNRGRELGVDYTRLYEVPDGGFQRAVRERKRREKEDKDSSRVRSPSRPRAKGTGQYERVAMDEV